MNSSASRLKLGVTFHSFTHEYVSYVWSFDDMMYNATQLGGGVEITGPSHHRGSPRVPDEFITSFRNSVARYRLTPMSYGTYADAFMRWDRPLSEDEIFDYTVPQLVGAARLGFPIARLQHFASPIVERLIPLAEKLDIILAYELHAPLNLYSSRVQELVAQIRRVGSKHLGLIPDAGIFARSVSQFRLDEGIRLGLTPRQVDAVLSLWKERRELEEAGRLLAHEGVNQQGREWAYHLWGSYGQSDPSRLADIFEHVVHVHAKFFSMKNGEEPDIRYRDLVGVLLDLDYRGWISSEYEGPPADGFEMVAQQQDMIRRYESEHLAARRVPEPTS